MSNKVEATYHGGEYTPEPIDLRVAYRLMEADLMMDPNSKPHDPELQAESDAEFDRFIAKIKAEAWDEGAMASESLSCENPPCGVCEHCGTPLGNPYRREP